MSKKKILICGASGFIGRNVAEHYARQDDFDVYGTYCIRPTEIAGVQMVKADLTNKDDVASVIKGMDVLIQAAATTSGSKDITTKPYIHVTDNAVMNALIFRAAYEQQVAHVVFFSCTVMYHSSDQPIKEADFDANRPMHPKYFPAGWTKVYNEKMCEFYSGLGTTKYTAIRHSNIYGPYDKYDLERSHVFGATMTKVMTAEDGGKIVVWGTGEEERDLLYVDDLTSFVSRAVAKQDSPFELMNVGCGRATSVKDLVNKIIQCSGKNITIEHDTSKPTIKTSLCLDITRAKDKFKWMPQVSIDDGIQKTIQWYKANIKPEEAVFSG